jgi:hypothetical protein
MSAEAKRLFLSAQRFAAERDTAERERDVLAAEVAGLRERAERAEAIVQRVALAHRAVVNSVTPKHPDSVLAPKSKQTPEQAERHERVWSEWHAASREAEVAALEAEALAVPREEEPRDA